MDEKAVREQLLGRLEELRRRVAKIETDVRHSNEPLDKDSAEQSLQLENDEVLSALDDAGRQELVDIRETLRRLDAGTYGTCTRCEEPIAPARLRAIPTAALCIRCAEGSEA